MGLFSSRSSSKVNNDNSVIEIVNNNVDSDESDEVTKINLNTVNSEIDTLTIRPIDYGTVKNSFALAVKALDETSENYDKALITLSDNSNNAIKTLAETTSSESGEILDNVGKWAVLGILSVGAIYWINKK